MKKMFVRLNLDHLKNENWFEFMKLYADTVREVGAETLKLADVWEAFMTAKNEADLKLEEIRKSVLTEKLEELDHRRDQMFSGLHKQVESYLIGFDAAKAEIAKRVIIVFNTYGNVAREDILAESAALYNLLTELRTNYTADMATLGLSQWLTELDKANKEFENTWKERNQKQSDIVVKKSMKQIRKEMNRMYLDMIERIEVLVKIEGLATWETFIEEWNGIVTKFKNQLAQEEGMKEADKENNKVDNL